MKPNTIAAILVLIVAVIAGILTPLPRSLPHKLALFSSAIRYEMMCDDLLPRSPPLPLEIVSKQATASRTKRRSLLFIRHAESEWNTMANATLPLQTRAWNFLRNVAREIDLLFTADPAHVVDSAFYDASISNRGWSQALRLADEFHLGRASKTSSSIGQLISSKKKLTLIASNLRRSIETAKLALKPLLDRDETLEIHVDSSLQEACSKIDALSFQENAGPLDTRVRLKNNMSWTRVVSTWNLEGNKQLGKSSVWSRQNLFVERIFNSEFDDAFDEDEEDSLLIVVGHSAWFRRFFWRYAVDRSKNSQLALAGTKKLTNCAAAKFDLVVDSATKNVPFIDPSTFEVLYGGLV